MTIYFIIFFIAFAFAYIAEKNLKSNKKILFYCFSFLAICIPSLLAGLRASGIGTDTQVYMDWVFRESVFMRNIADMLNFIEISGIEILYCFINYIVSRFTNNLSVIYFILEFIFLIFSYAACVKVSRKINISHSFSYLIFLLLFFNKSLNLCRQSLAMSICLFSIPYIIERDWKKFFALMLIAVGLHKSAILFVPLYFIYNFTMSKTKLNMTVCLSSILILLISVIFFKNIVVLLVNIGILSDKYLNYVYVFGDTNNIKFIEIFSQLVICGVTVLLSKHLIKKESYNKFFIYVVILSFVTFLFGYNATYSQRISYYYSTIVAFIIPQLVRIFKSNSEKIIIGICLTLLVCAYSYLYYDKYKFDQTIPYVVDTSIKKYIN